MAHIVSSHPVTAASSSRIPAGLLTAGRFVLHFAEMWMVMFVGMVIFMAIPGVMALPSLLHQMGMAIAMSLPMVVWMRIRGHGWRHGIERALGMLVPWAVVVGLVGLGAANVLSWLADADTASMALGMLGIMLFRREHYASGAHHAHAVPRSESQPRRHIPWRRIVLVTAYVSAIVLSPGILGTLDGQDLMSSPDVDF